MRPFLMKEHKDLFAHLGIFAQVCARQAGKANGQFTPANDGLRRLDFARFGSTPDNRRLNCAPFDQRIERKSASGL